MQYMLRFWLIIAVLFTPVSVLAQQPLVVTTTIKPFYNLIAMLTAGTNIKLTLLLTNNASPHDYAIKPSDLTNLRSSNLVVWGGANLEPSIAKALNQLSTKTLDLSTVPKLQLLPMRNPSTQCHCKHTLGADNHDPHYWLAYNNAIAILETAAQNLNTMLPKQQRAIITANLKSAKNKIMQQAKDIKRSFSNLPIAPFLVFHDAYQYFEQDYNLPSFGAITLNPETPPTTKRFQEIESQIRNKTIKCIFSEPQFSAKIINNLRTAHPDLIYAQLDPIGSDQDLGPTGYLVLLGNLAKSFQICSC